eukprot:5320176-Alexandrium_andersonii.AAC.1
MVLQLVAVVGQRLTYTDKCISGVAHSLQQFAAVCSGLLRGLPGGATAPPEPPPKKSTSGARR